MNLVKMGMILIIAGILLVVLSMLALILFTATGAESITIGGCIVILFIPICFGVGEAWHWSLLLSIALALLVFVIGLYLTMNKTRLDVKDKQVY